MTLEYGYPGFDNADDGGWGGGKEGRGEKRTVKLPLTFNAIQPKVRVLFRV